MLNTKKVEKLFT